MVGTLRRGLGGFEARDPRHDMLPDLLRPGCSAIGALDTRGVRQERRGDYLHSEKSILILGPPG